MPTKINFHPKFSHQNKYRYNHACARSIDCDILGSAFIDISDFAHTFILSIRGTRFVKEWVFCGRVEEKLGLREGGLV